MRWTKNPGRAKRIKYVEDRWVKDGRQMASIEPNGLAGFFVSEVKRDIHGDEVMAETRRTRLPQYIRADHQVLRTSQERSAIQAALWR
jgi:hypothetical protein